MTLRRLTSQDATALRALWAEGLRNIPAAFLLTEEELLAIPEDRFAAGIPAQHWFGAFQKETLVGYVAARPGNVSRLRHTADIGPLYVAPSAQGQGLGRALMETLLNHLTGEGLLQVELSVDATNTKAIALYESLGFATFGRRPRSVIIDDISRIDLLMIRALDGADLTPTA